MRRLTNIVLLLLLITILSACSGGATTSNQPPVEIGSLVRSGGILGETWFVRVYDDGTLTYGTPDGSVLKIAQASSAQVESLRAAFDSMEWQELGESYGRQLPDGFAYTISGGGRTIQTYDDAPNPPALDNVLRDLIILMQQAQRS